MSNLRVFSKAEEQEEANKAALREKAQAEKRAREIAKKKALEERQKQIQFELERQKEIQDQVCRCDLTPATRPLASCLPVHSS